MTLRILILDDSRACRRLAEVILSRQGHTAIPAATAAAAAELAGEHARAGFPFDAVVVTLDIRGVSGLSVLAGLRAGAGAGPLRAVAVTADTDSYSPQSVAAGGFDELLVKPFTVDALVAAVEGAGALRSETAFTRRRR